MKKDGTLKEMQKGVGWSVIESSLFLLSWRFVGERM